MNGDPFRQALSIVAQKFLAYPFLIAHENDRQIRVVPECGDCTFNGIPRGKIPAHRVKGNFHAGETRPAGLFGTDGQDLPLVIISAGWAGDVGEHAGSALRAFSKFRCAPAVGGFACAKSHL